MVDELKRHIKNRDLLALSDLLGKAERFSSQNPEQRDLLLDELEIQIEDLKSDAVRMFDREDFAPALEIFEFVARVKPRDRISTDYLQICRQFCQPLTSDGARQDTGNPTGGVEVDRDIANQAHGLETSELTRKMRTYFDRRDFDALKGVVKEALGQGPTSDRARRLEEEELKAEFDTHVRKLKNEAIQQFEGGDYCACLGTFRFLCELEPGNPDLNRSLQTCLEFAQEHQARDESRMGGGGPKLFDVWVQGQSISSQSAEDGPSPSDDILEVPAVYQPEAPASNALEIQESAKAWLSLRFAWLKFALPAFGAICLLMWLAIPRSSPQLSESGDARSEEFRSAALVTGSREAKTGRLREGLTQATEQQLGFDSYPVLHDHFIGSCKGTLKINPDTLSFVPMGGSKDAFTQPLSRIKIRWDDLLEIETNQNSYRLEVMRGKTDRQTKKATKELYELLRRRQRGS
jgi:tetratricopeptide (TPR) repeat protein